MFDTGVFKNSVAGFTLIELLAVLTLIAILAAFTVPNVMVSHSDPRQETIGIINAALSEARNSSTLQRKRHEIILGRHSLQIVPAAKQVVFPDEVELVEVEIEGDEERNPDEFPVSLPFHPRGNTMAARMVFADMQRGEDIILLITPFGFSAKIEDD